MEQISQDIFQKWKENDKEIRNQVWEWIFKKFYQRAVVTCFRCCGCDPQTGEQMAADTLAKTFEEIDRKVKTCQVDWQGEKEFSSYVWQRLFKRCLDEARKLKKFWERTISIFNETEDETSLVDILRSPQPPPEEEAIQKETLAFLYETFLNFPVIRLKKN